MGSRTKIEWTGDGGASWNPIRGCSRVSPGCKQCYAEGAALSANRQMAALGRKEPYAGLIKLTKKGEPTWTGKVAFVPEHFADPLRWKRPRKVFVNSMSDMFHEKLDFETIAAIFGVMLAAPQHTFQVLTKRAERMVAFYDWLKDSTLAKRSAQLIDGGVTASADHLNEGTFCVLHAIRRLKLDKQWFEIPESARAALIELGDPRMADGLGGFRRVAAPPFASAWQHIWMGVSVENQDYALTRIPQLLLVPAPVRWVSYEPAIGGIHLAPEWLAGLNWIVVGGESGDAARTFNVQWAREVIKACRGSNVRVFMKQLGARAVDCTSPNGRTDGHLTYARRGVDGCPACAFCAGELPLAHRKGGKPIEWPEDLRVREYPDHGAT